MEGSTLEGSTLDSHVEFLAKQGLNAVSNYGVAATLAAQRGNASSEAFHNQYMFNTAVVPSSGEEFLTEALRTSASLRFGQPPISTPVG